MMVISVAAKRLWLFKCHSVQWNLLQDNWFKWGWKFMCAEDKKISFVKSYKVCLCFNRQTVFMLTLY